MTGNGLSFCLVPLAALLASLGAHAQTVTFEAALTAHGECRDQIALVPMDLAQMREYLFAEVPPGEWEARVVDLETGEAVLSQTDLELDDDGNAMRGTVYWLVAGQQAEGTVRRLAPTESCTSRAGPGRSTPRCARIQESGSARCATSRFAS